MLLVPHLPTPSPERAVRTQPHLGPAQCLVISLSLLMVWTVPIRWCMSVRRSLDVVSFRFLWQESVRTPFLPFFCVVCYDYLPIQLGRHIFLFRFTRCLHTRADPPGGGTKTWLSNTIPHPETPSRHTAMPKKPQKTPTERKNMKVGHNFPPLQTAIFSLSVAHLLCPSTKWITSPSPHPFRV